MAVSCHVATDQRLGVEGQAQSVTAFGMNSYE